MGNRKRRNAAGGKFFCLTAIFVVFIRFVNSVVECSLFFSCKPCYDIHTFFFWFTWWSFDFLIDGFDESILYHYQVYYTTNFMFMSNIFLQNKWDLMGVPFYKLVH